MPAIPEAVRKAVANRAAHRCEYCQLLEDDDVYAFHVEHIIALKHGGGDEFDNLAFACQNCNLHKGSNLTGIDPVVNGIVELFHPRKDVWRSHFSVVDGRFLGITPCGRATIQVLNINSPDRVRLRQLLGFRID